MGKIIWKEGTFKIGGVDLSDHVADADIKLSKSAEDVTGLNFGGGHDWEAGLADEEWVLTFFNDEDAGSVTQTLLPIYQDETEEEAELIPQSGAASDTNPRYRANVKLFNYDPVNAAIGAASKSQVTFKVIGLTDRYTT